MATYIIGDIHGFDEVLMNLIERINFDPSRDRLWFVGDLVNNGPGSARVIRWIKAHEEQSTVVLGNHDLHMLSVWSGASKARKKDTFSDVLLAEDSDELCQWLLHRPLLHTEGEHVLVHAGIHPQWSMEQACAIAAEVEAHLRGPDVHTFFKDMYGNLPTHPQHVHSVRDRLRLGVNVFTRMRALTDGQNLEFAYKRPLDQMPSSLEPWFRGAAHPSQHDRTIFFGHWSALGLHHEGRAWCLDSGCTWGRMLTALRLEDHEYIQVPSS